MEKNTHTPEDAEYSISSSSAVALSSSVDIINPTSTVLSSSSSSDNHVGHADAVQGSGEGFVDVSRRIEHIKEMFPTLDTATIGDILAGNEWDMTASSEAALGRSFVRFCRL